VAVVPSAVRAVAILRASCGAAPRRATDGGAPPRSSDNGAPKAGDQAAMTLSKWTSGSGTQGPVATTVVRGAVGIDNSGGGHECRGSLRRSHDCP
jgi:hypothetical protein